MIIATVLAAVLGAIALALALPTFADLWSLVRATGGARPDRAPEPPRLLVLVPAHDEEVLIGGCVASLLAAEHPVDRRRVVVVADNCTDGTAAIAREHGADALERTDPVLRGKPRALAWALTQLPVDTFDAIIIVDADTVVDRRFYAELADFAGLRDLSVQANYGVSNATDNDITWLSTIFGDARYHFAFLLKDRAGLTVPLGGNGMCIGTNVLATHGLQAFSICEDWELYAQYTTWKVPIHVAPNAFLFAQEANTLAGSESQRERWAAGKMGVLLRYGRGILFGRGIGLHQKLDALGELIAPGPVVHLGMVLLLQALLLFVRVPYEGWIAALLWLGIGRQVFYAVLAARRTGGIGRFLRALKGMPAYLVWRMRIQLSALRMVNSDAWIKTERNQPGAR